LFDRYYLKPKSDVVRPTLEKSWRYSRLCVLSSFSVLTVLDKASAVAAPRLSTDSVYDMDRTFWLLSHFWTKCAKYKIVTEANNKGSKVLLSTIFPALSQEVEAKESLAHRNRVLGIPYITTKNGPRCHAERVLALGRYY
jgi:hypothetical protein